MFNLQNTFSLSHPGVKIYNVVWRIFCPTFYWMVVTRTSQVWRTTLNNGSDITNVAENAHQRKWRHVRNAHRRKWRHDYAHVRWPTEATSEQDPWDGSAAELLNLRALGGRQPTTREPPVPRDEHWGHQWAAEAHFRPRLVDVVVDAVINGQVSHNGVLGTRIGLSWDTDRQSKFYGVFSTTVKTRSLLCIPELKSRHV